TSTAAPAPAESKPPTAKNPPSDARRPPPPVPASASLPEQLMNPAATFALGCRSNHPRAQQDGEPASHAPSVPRIRNSDGTPDHYPITRPVHRKRASQSVVQGDSHGQGRQRKWRSDSQVRG